MELLGVVMTGLKEMFAAFSYPNHHVSTCLIEFAVRGLDVTFSSLSQSQAMEGGLYSRSYHRGIESNTSQLHTSLLAGHMCVIWASDSQTFFMQRT